MLSISLMILIKSFVQLTTNLNEIHSFLKSISNLPLHTNTTEGKVCLPIFCIILLALFLEMHRYIDGNITTGKKQSYS